MNSVSIVFCEFKRVANEMMEKLSFNTIIISNYQIETLFHFKVNEFQYKHVFS